MSNIGGIDKLKIEVEFPNKRNNINILLDSIKSFGEIKKVSDLFDSNIQFDEYFVESWLNHRKFKTELLYRKSRDGSKPDDFHNKCDNQGITITFIETTKDVYLEDTLNYLGKILRNIKMINLLFYFQLIKRKNI